MAPGRAPKGMSTKPMASTFTTFSTRGSPKKPDHSGALRNITSAIVHEVHITTPRAERRVSSLSSFCRLMKAVTPKSRNRWATATSTALME
jgi:hypothetical protein